MSKTVKITASTTRPLTGKAAAKARKFESRKTRALSIRGNKRKFQELTTMYGLTERMAVKLLTIYKL